MTATTIKLDVETRERLKTFGHKGETYDDLLNRMMDYLEGRLGNAAPPEPSASQGVAPRP